MNNPMEMMGPLMAKMAATGVDPDKIFKFLAEAHEIVPRLKHNHALLVEIAKKMGLEHID
jgi:hypothetical protein